MLNLTVDKLHVGNDFPIFPDKRRHNLGKQTFLFFFARLSFGILVVADVVDGQRMIVDSQLVLR